MPSRRRRGRLPDALGRVEITDLSRRGEGIATIDNRTVLIDGGLAGEVVDFRYVRRQRGYDTGQVTEIRRPSSVRAVPPCPHFGVCGGCSLQHLRPDRQIRLKEDWLLDTLRRSGGVEPERVLPPISGGDLGYRRKARLGARYVPGKGRVLVGFRERHAPYVADIRSCVILDPRLDALLMPLSETVGSLSIRARIPQIEVAAGDSGVALNLRLLESASDQDCARLADFASRHDVQIYLQTKGPESITPLGAVDAPLTYRLDRHGVEFHFRSHHFTQVNAEINQLMIDRVLDLLELTPTTRVLDLFCGLGNFTLPIARRTATVTGVEGEPTLVQWADENAARNGLANATFQVADLDVDANTETWLPADCDRVLLDPPRLGAARVIPLLGQSGAPLIAYVSCQPDTLARDAATLVHAHGYRLTAAGVIDMFPHTAHVESVAVFKP